MTYDDRTSLLQAGNLPPKLLIERRAEGPVTCLRLSGVIDEQFDGVGLARTVAARHLILDLGGVDRISSFGIRQWVDFVNAAAGRVSGIFFVECSPKVVDQFNMVANFGGSGHIVSFYAPYRCDACNHDRRRLFRTDEETPLWRAGQAPSFACPTCGSQEYFDEDPATYFSFVAQQPQVPLPPEVAAFLRTQLSYGQGGQRKLKIEKRVEGRITQVKLSGDLDSDLRAQKLAEGLEGEVVFDLSGVLSIDPVGAAQWRKLMQLLDTGTGGGERVDRVHLLGVPAPFLERLGRTEDLTRKGQVLSVLVPYNCPRCRAMTQRQVDFAVHGAELRAGKVPRTQCGVCGGPASCVVSETWLARLTALPVPRLGEELQRALSRLYGAAPNRPSASPAPAPNVSSWTAQAAPTPQAVPLPVGVESTLKQQADGPARPTRDIPTLATGLVRVLQIPGLVPGLLVVLLAISAAFVIRILLPQGASGPRWQVLERSDPHPPAWRSGTDTGKGGEPSFVGRSAFQPEQKDALEQAEDAALVEVVNRLAEGLARDPMWDQTVPPLYQTAQREALSALHHDLGDEPGAPAKPDPHRDEGLRRAHDGQRRVAASLRAGADGLVLLRPQPYWEKLGRNGKSGPNDVLYQAAVRLDLSQGDLDHLLARYGQQESPPGMKVLPYFPLLSWRFDILGGVVVSQVDPDGAYAAAGLQKGDVIVAAFGQEVRRPADLLGAISRTGADAGGTLRVQRGETMLELQVPSKRTPTRNKMPPLRRPRNRH